MIRPSHVPDVTFEQLDRDVWSATPNSAAAREAVEALAVRLPFPAVRVAGMVCLEARHVDDFAGVLESRGFSTIV